jgi:hypothetical protein
MGGSLDGVVGSGINITCSSIAVKPSAIVAFAAPATTTTKPYPKPQVCITNIVPFPGSIPTTPGCFLHIVSGQFHCTQLCKVRLFLEP